MENRTRNMRGGSSRALGMMVVLWAGMTALVGVPSLALGGNEFSLPIANRGFEADVVSDGCFAVFQPTGWAPYDPNGILNASGNVLGGINTVDWIYFPGGSPEGNHSGIVFLADTIGAGPAGLTQVLSGVLEADTTYTLLAHAGNIASGTGPPPCDVFGFFDLDGFPGYQVQLLAGGVVIGQDDNSLFGMIPEGEFRLSSVQVTVGAGHPQLGQPLEVRLVNLNEAETPQDPGIEVDFDNVSLVAQPATDPALGDLDADGDVDLADLALMARCFAGESQPPAADCPPEADADIDNDGDTDLTDYSFLSIHLTGPQ